MNQEEIEAMMNMMFEENENEFHISGDKFLYDRLSNKCLKSYNGYDTEVEATFRYFQDAVKKSYDKIDLCKTSIKVEELNIEIILSERHDLFMKFSEEFL